MHHFRIRYLDAHTLRRALDEELARGVVLVKVAPPEGIEFRDPCALEIAAPSGSVDADVEVMSVMPGIGVALTFPAERIAAARALLDGIPESVGEAEHALVSPEATPSAEESRDAGLNSAQKIHLAMHGTRDDRAAILRDQNRALHSFVLKSPQVTQDEIVAWAKNPQMNAEFLRQIGDRKDWLGRSNIAQGLARNPKTPADLAVRALEFVGSEALRQMAKGIGVPPHVAQAARKRVITK